MAISREKKRAYDKEYYRKHSTKKKASASAWEKNNPLRKVSTYGITKEQYLSLLEDQQGVCAICKSPETHLKVSGLPRALSVDHDHITGKVRGLLCSNCNKALGLFSDRMDLLQEALNYLSISSKVTED